MLACVELVLKIFKVLILFLILMGLEHVLTNALLWKQGTWWGLSSIKWSWKTRGIWQVWKDRCATVSVFNGKEDVDKEEAANASIYVLDRVIYSTLSTHTTAICSLLFHYLC